MDISIKVNNTERKNFISWQTLRKDDAINYQIDTLSFETKRYGDKDWRPNVGDEIEVFDGTEKIFGGVIVQIEEKSDSLILKYFVNCKDYTHYLDRALVVERYENVTVNQIIDDINSNYLSGFTISHVSCPVVVASVAFNRLPVSKCLQQLADQVNYNWYVDYDKDIHFFAKNSEPAPYSISDDAGNHIDWSLKIKDDLSQIRNRVFIRGGEMKGNARTENFLGDGAKKTFALGHKFSDLPTVTVGGSAVTVGVDFLDKDEDFDCFWNYNEKYVRFITAPADAVAVAITGTPLIPITVQVQDDASISKYGVYEFSKVDKTITTKEEAKQYAIAQLESYANKIQEAEFSTYKSGFRSGQVVNIQSDQRDLNENFIIQRVSLTMRSQTDGLFGVQLATMRTLGIIDILQKMIGTNDRQIKIDENTVLEKYYTDNQTVRVTEEITLKVKEQDYQTVEVEESIEKDPFGDGVPPNFVLAPHFPEGHDDLDREMRLDISSYLY